MDFRDVLLDKAAAAAGADCTDTPCRLFISVVASEISCIYDGVSQDAQKRNVQRVTVSRTLRGWVGAKAEAETDRGSCATIDFRFRDGLDEC